MYELSTATIQTILKNSDKYVDVNVNEASKHLKQSDDIEAALESWLAEIKSHNNITLNGQELRAQALKFGCMLGHTQFQASQGWLNNFKKRHNITSKNNCGEAGLVDPITSQSVTMNEVSFKSSTVLNKSLSNSFSNLNASVASDGRPRKDLNRSASKKKTVTIQNEVHKVPFYPASIHNSSKNLKKSIADNNLVPYDSEKSTLFSTWTPLSDEKSNNKLYEERKQLFEKWFETWNDSQRRTVIEETLQLCKPKQLFFARDTLNKISPVYSVDFSRTLPRVICLYIFSFLDPRSLCRCAQVCWYWKMMAETDQLWMAKCLRFGWNLNYIPNSFENGIWKQFYIENIKALQYVPVKKPNTPLTTDRTDVNLEDLSNGKFGFSYYIKNAKTNTRTIKSNPLKQPPWKANKSNPNHFYRFNYLDNNSEDNDKRTDHLIKTLALDSSTKKHPKTTTTLKKTNQVTKKLELETSQLNQSKLENLIAKGEHLMNQINKEAQESDIMQNLNDNKSNGSLASYLAMRRSILLNEHEKPSKDVWKLLNTTNESEK